MRLLVRCSATCFHLVIFLGEHTHERPHLLLRRLLGAALSTENFEELSNAVISARKRRSGLSRSDQLVLLREINNKINSYFRSFDDVHPKSPDTCFSYTKHNYLDFVRNSLK